MPKAICTLAIGENEFYRRCLKTHVDYAKKIGVRHLIIDTGRIEFDSMPHLNKIKAFEYLKDYDEILYLDADVYIVSNAENIFDVYVNTASDIIALNEANYRFTNYQVEGVCKSLKTDSANWPRNKANNYDYYNTGVLLLRHGALRIAEEFDWKWFLLNPKAHIAFEQSYLNYIFQKCELILGDLSSEFNHNFFTNWYFKEGVSFVHYAGINKKYINELDRVDSKVLNSVSRVVDDNTFSFRSLNRTIYLSSRKWIHEIKSNSAELHVTSQEKGHLYGWYKGRFDLKDLSFLNNFLRINNRNIYLNSVKYKEISILVYWFQTNFIKLKIFSFKALQQVKQKGSFIKFLFWQSKLFSLKKNNSKILLLAKIRISEVARRKLEDLRFLYVLRASRFYKLLSKNYFEILHGPFEGIKMSSGGFDILGSSFYPKIFGHYENEIIEYVILFFNRNTDNIFVNIGCGEGYYIVASKNLLTKSDIIAVDIDSSVLKVLKDNLVLNEINQKVTCLLKMERTDLLNLGLEKKSGFVMCDCEGYEDNLFDLEVFQALAKFDIIIECHDFIIPEITNKLFKYAVETHLVDVVYSISDYLKPSLFKIPLLDELDYDQQYKLMKENRPEGMTWLILKSKHNNNAK
jgi:hypothetical protein